MKKPTPLTERWPCCFAHPSVRDAIDPWISDSWLRIIGGKVPFGDIRNQWRKHHCRTLNPYGSEDCPDDKIDCALIFQECVKLTLKAKPKKPVAYFIKVARMRAAQRADQGLTRRISKRYGVSETFVPSSETATEIGAGVGASQGPSDTSHEASGVPQGQGVRSPSAGPIGIGELLGSLDIRPRPPQPDEREESAE